MKIYHQAEDGIDSSSFAHLFPAEMHSSEIFRNSVEEKYNDWPLEVYSLL